MGRVREIQHHNDNGGSVCKVLPNQSRITKTSCQVETAERVLVMSPSRTEEVLRAASPLEQEGSRAWSSGEGPDDRAGLCNRMANIVPSAGKPLLQSALETKSIDRHRQMCGVQENTGPRVTPEVPAPASQPASLDMSLSPLGGPLEKLTPSRVLDSEGGSHQAMVSFLCFIMKQKCTRPSSGHRELS